MNRQEGVMHVRISLLSLILFCATLLAQAQNPVPLINQPLVPDAVAPGGPGFTLTVNGTGFVSGSVVNWNGSPRATTFVSSSQLTAAIDASDIATEGTAQVTVVSPGPGGGASNAAFFETTNATSAFTLHTLALRGRRAALRGYRCRLQRGR